MILEVTGVVDRAERWTGEAKKRYRGERRSPKDERWCINTCWRSSTATLPLFAGQRWYERMSKMSGEEQRQVKLTPIHVTRRSMGRWLASRVQPGADAEGRGATWRAARRDTCHCRWAVPWAPGPECSTSWYSHERPSTVIQQSRKLESDDHMHTQGTCTVQYLCLPR